MTQEGGSHKVLPILAMRTRAMTQEAASPLREEMQHTEGRSVVLFVLLKHMSYEPTEEVGLGLLPF